MKRSLAAAHLLALATLTPARASAQNVEGQVIAAQYGQWRVPGTSTNNYSFVAAACQQVAGSKSFQAFAVGTPVKIIDANPNQSEVVTPTAVQSNNQGCAITIAPASEHDSFNLSSATGGLQEAINSNLTVPTVNTIVLTQRWYELGGSTGMIGTVTGSTQLNLVDVTKAPYDWYTWNGSQYVKVAIGGATLPQNTVPYQGALGTQPVPATPVNILGPFVTTTTAPGTVTLLNTVFNEAAPGSTLLGTTPSTMYTPSAWTGGSQATYTSTGASLTGNGSQSAEALINLGMTDYTVTYTGVPSASGNQIILRWLDDNNFIAVNMAGSSVLVFNVVGGTAYSYFNIATPSAPTTGTVSATLSGHNLSLTAFGVTGSGTQGNDANLSATRVGFVNSNSGGVMTVSSINATGTGLIPATGPCVGSPVNDGNCYTLNPHANTALSGDGQGNIVTMPEKGTAYVAGHGNVAWDEDYKLGRFDPRNIKYSGGIFGPNPTAAIQGASDAAACALAQGTISQAVIQLPQGQFTILGTITIAPGADFTGMGNATGGTVLLQGYTNSTMLAAPPSRTLTCNGTSVTDGASQTIIQKLTLGGCGQGGCQTKPGDTNPTGNGGPLDVSMEMASTGGEVRNVDVDHFGGSGMIIDGTDTKYHHVRTTLNMEFFLFNNYTFATGEYHCDLVVSGADTWGDDAELYGTFHSPATEYGHLCGLLAGGGDSTHSRTWPQVEEIGILQPYGFGANNSFLVPRIDFSEGEGFVTKDVNVQLLGGVIDASCLAQSVVTLQNGYCDQASMKGLSPTIAHTQFAFNPGFGASYATADIWGQFGGRFDVDPSVTFEHTTTYFGTFDHSPSHIPINGTGPLPNMQNHDAVTPVDTTDTVWTGLANVTQGDNVWIYSNAHTILGSYALSHGNFITCSGGDLRLDRPGWVEVKVINPELYTAGSALLALASCSNGATAYQRINWDGQPAVAPNDTFVSDIQGSGIYRQMASLPTPVISANTTANSYSYCNVVKVYLAGSAFTSPQVCSNQPPPATGSTNTFNVTEPIFTNWDTVEVYSINTDPGLASGLVYTQSSGTTPGIGFNLSFAEKYVAPINTNSPGPLNQNPSGVINIGHPAPAHGDNCRDGDFTHTLTNDYYCHPANTWNVSPRTYTPL